jgi:hypothetical protein
MGMTIARLEMQKKEADNRSRSSSPMRRKVKQQTSYRIQRSAANNNDQGNNLYE